jgi:hypothetical protein
MMASDEPQPPGEFEIAAEYDFADPQDGPGFAPDHAVIDDPQERDRLLTYLSGGEPALTTTALRDDVRACPRGR